MEDTILKTIEEAIGGNISWLQTMKQKNGYAGPVVHYWRDCLRYIGPGLDWRYEGLIQAYITLFEKTKSNFFLDLAIEAGNHLVKNQLPNSCFRNSNFESNPSFRSGGTPHESAACIGLLKLAKKLKDLNLNWQSYYIAAKKNMDIFHLKVLWDNENRIFYQYIFDRRSHIPNKIATIIEFLLLLYEFTKEERYLKYATFGADFIVSQQNLEDFYGGIYQSDNLRHRHFITYYTARCIPALLQIYNYTKNDKYIHTALGAAEFIKKMEHEDGGFYFGFVRSEFIKDMEQKEDKNELKLCKYPIWIAGSADILRALFYLNEYKKYNLNKNIKWILSNIDENGGIRNSFGMNFKNKIGDYRGLPSWRDVIHVVGWNDKPLRLFSEMLEKGYQIEINRQMPTVEIECSDGLYYEDDKIIKIESDKENYIFRKDSLFSGRNIFLKTSIMKFGFLYSKYRKTYSFENKVLDWFKLK